MILIRVFIACFIMIIISGCKDGKFTDPRDGHEYEFKVIGTQTWMTENLAYLPEVSFSYTESNNEKHYYVYDYEGTHVIAAKAEVNYQIYGVLYNWEAAKTACPTGWHLPSDDEWTILTDWLITKRYGYGDSGDDIGKSLASTSGWSISTTEGSVGSDHSTNNSCGFNAIPSGLRYIDGGFGELGLFTRFWSSSEGDYPFAWYRELYYESADMDRYYDRRRSGWSVRCIKD